MYVDYTESDKIEFSSKSELAYLNELGECSPLKKQEIRDLITEIKKKKKSTLEKTKAKLVKANLRFVARVANYHNYKDNNIELSDLIQEGNIGLLQAVNDIESGKYNKKKNKSFISYAVWRIRGRILDFINKSKRNTQSYDTFSDIYEESNVELYSSDLNKFRENVSYNEIQDMFDYEHDMTSLDMFFNNMTQREEIILREYYGIAKKDDTNFKYDKTFEEVGELLDLSSYICSKIHKRALRRVQTMIAVNSILFI
jgi:RNA polymerase sigma factor (sigma-70 family)